MRRLSDATSRVVGKNFSRKFVSIGRIVKAWPDVMGQQFAEKAVPVKLRYRKPKSKTDKPIAVLEIGCSASDATMMHYQKDIILQRIAHLFGESWITDIKFITMDIRKNRLLTKKQVRPLTGEQKNHLSEVLGDIEDQAIYERLQALGEGILKHES